MEQLLNDSYLCKQLIEINKKYSSNSFIDIDFIDLFGLNSISVKTLVDLDKIKRKITAKYYNLALKYHPDKYSINKESIITIKACFVSIDEIKSGEFLSFINDIYEMINNMIIEDPESLINIINGNTDNVLNKFDINGDFFNLKRRFDVNIISNEYNKADNKQIKEFENELNKVKIIDSKLDENNLKYLIEQEENKREILKIDQLFTETQTIDPNFNNIFNNFFHDTKEASLNILDDKDGDITNITAFNFNNNYDLSSIVSSIGLSTSVTDISEAFSPIKVNSNIKPRLFSYDELLADRILQDKMFKNAKLSKENNN
jgi:hypothetical protein